MRLLQRHILLELIKVFFSILSVLTILLVFFGVIREASENGLGPLQVLKILPFVVPSLMPFTVPATLLLTVCIVYGRLSGDLEITAAKAAGINVLSLLWPAFILGISLSICSLVLSDRVIPWAAAKIRTVITLAMEDIFLDMLRSQHQISERGKGVSITVMGVDGKKLLMPTFQYMPHGQSPITLQAQEATLEFQLEQQQVMLHLVKGYIDIPGQRRVWFEREDRPFPLPKEIRKPKPVHLEIENIKHEAMELSQRLDDIRLERDVETAFVLATGQFGRFTEPQIKDLTQQIHYNHIDLAKLNTEIHNRFALSTSCFFFALVGGPFAILQGRRQFLTTFFLCFLPILLIYYPVVMLMLNLAKTGAVNPAWSMWVANSLISIVGFYVLRKVLKY